MFGQAQSLAQVQHGVETYGPAPGGQKLMNAENEAAQLAMRTGLYVTWRSRKTNEDCSRVGPKHKCFCGHLYSEHALKGRGLPKCTACPCRCYDFVPSRPEEVGDWWLPRRKGFNVHTWRAKCHCGQPHDLHDPVTRGGCCPGFKSNYLCIVCECHQEEHETVFEDEAERVAAGRPVREAFVPLAELPDLQKLVLKPKPKGKAAPRRLGGPKAAAEPPPEETPEQLMERGAITTTEYFELIKSSGAEGSSAGPPARAKQLIAPANTLDTTGYAEKSVRLMHETSGGRCKGTVVNKFGLTEESLRAHGTQRAQDRWLEDQEGAPRRLAPKGDKRIGAPSNDRHMQR
ncbi:hypothetical protein CYMTET_45159 [Cymbomonas tetramitiformis]|uniref:Uncharacterized protein n=1 Tax=Cymbomonas tetramitiformis TaxID=36881 RepID=A0AAE0BYS6_9CHLO|nr:hypothetical protein CYMTET_45159 [Cymbomonas tetramitiformis]